MHGRVPLPSAPEVTPRRRRPVDRWRIGWGGLVSALLHGGFFAALLFGAGRERPPEPLPPPSFDVEFMRAGGPGGASARASARRRGG